MSLRIIFFGSPEFAVPTLSALADDDRFDVAVVVSQPDRTAGRGRRLVEPPVKTAAAERSLRVWQPQTLRSPEIVDKLKAANPDLFVVVAYGEIFRRDVLAIPTHGCLNVHPSLLPRYRGSSPIPAAILNGDKTTGVSIIEMVRKLDAGPIVAQREVELHGDETAETLSIELANLAARMMPDVAADWCNGRIDSRPQDDESATITRELTKDDGRIDWSRSAVEIEREVRAYSPWPTAWTTLDGKRLVVHSAKVWSEHGRGEPGMVGQAGRRVIVTCGASCLELREVQPEGKRMMLAEDWWRGLRRDVSARFDSDSNNLNGSS